MGLFRGQGLNKDLEVSSLGIQSSMVSDERCSIRPVLVAEETNMKITRRTLFASALTTPFFSYSHARAAARPLVGAIRWDAWYGPGSIPTEAVTHSLSPPQYRWRLPFFAQQNASHVLLPAASQALMNLEIRQAEYAGLDYWAFVRHKNRPNVTGTTVLSFERHSTQPAILHVHSA